MDEIIEEFLVESAENLDRLDQELVELEEHPDSPDLIASVFRNVHTIKGTAGFFEFVNLEAVAHAGENLLSRLRDGELTSNSEITSALLATCDALRSMLEYIRETGTDGDDAYPELIARLKRLTAGEDTGESGATVVDTPAALDTSEPSEPSADTPTEPVPMAEFPSHPPPEPVPGPSTPVETVAADSSTPEPAPVPIGTDPTEPTGADTASSVSTPVTEGSIRVDVGLLDRLMNLVGELVLARNQVLQFQATSPDSAFHSTSQQLDLITTELQESVMKTRMQPIGSVWQKLPRVVRDLANQLGKKVRLVMEGEETELDKTLIEAIKDPLTHIVRNSVDHGLEAPEVRTARGKPETGTLKLRAIHEGGQVIIEITDDGAGLDYERIRAKAVASGLLTAEEAGRLTDRESAHLIFRPGFSTAATITNVSGRGVGMDVVKTNVEKIGGTIDVTSTPGAGTTLTIKIPLTLAIIPALIITCEEDRYLIPQINLVEVLRVDGSNADTRIETAANTPVLRLRGNLLPIVDLRDILGLGPRGIDDDGVSVAVLDADGTRFGLIVDQINDTEEIVVKPLSPHLKGIACFAGTTIMGDGAVSLILDTIGIARMAGVVHEDREGSEPVAAIEESSERRSPTTMVIVCTVGNQRLAIPLALISRLEELPSAGIERAAGREIIQYRNDLLQILHLDVALGERHGRDELPEMLKVLVHESRGGVYGLVVDDILDVHEINTDGVTPDGMRITGVIGRRVTDLINIDRLIETNIGRGVLVAGGGF